MTKNLSAVYLRRQLTGFLKVLLGCSSTRKPYLSSSFMHKVYIVHGTKILACLSFFWSLGVS